MPSSPEKGKHKTSSEELQRQIEALRNASDVSNLLLWLMAKKLGYKTHYVEGARDVAACLLLRIPEIRYWIKLNIYSELIASEVPPANEYTRPDLSRRFERWNTVSIDERDCFNAVFEALFGFVIGAEEAELTQAEADEEDRIAEKRERAEKD